MSGLMGDNSVFENHERHGPFLILRDLGVSDDPPSNSAFVRPDGGLIELQESCDVWEFFQLSGNFAVGAELSWKNYDSMFIPLGYPEQKHPGPIAIWDIRTGQRIRTLEGYHHGEFRGAQLLTDNRLITWARDFLIRVWDIDTGKIIETIPLPATLDEQANPIVSSRIFSDWTDEQRMRYVDEKDSLSFCVRLMVQTTGSPHTENYGPYRAPQPKSAAYEQLAFPRDQTIHRIPRPFRELENIEAGYSSSLVLQDGSLVIGGTTYGAYEHVYVWDGALDLTILISSLCKCCNFDIDGEIRAGVVQFSSPEGVMTFELDP